METASGSSTSSSETKLIPNPYKKKRANTGSDTPTKPKRKRTRKHKQPKEEKERENDEITEPTQEVDQIQPPKPTQRSITQYFRPIKTWPVFALSKYAEVQPTVASMETTEEEREIQDQVGPTNTLIMEEQQQETDIDDCLADQVLAIIEKVEKEEEETGDAVSRLTLKLMGTDELLYREEEEQDEHPEKDPEFVWKPPKRRKLPKWMALLRQGKKVKIPTVRRSTRLKDRMGSGISDPMKVWKPPLL